MKPGYRKFDARFPEFTHNFSDGLSVSEASG